MWLIGREKSSPHHDWTPDMCELYRYRTIFNNVRYYVWSTILSPMHTTIWKHMQLNPDTSKKIYPIHEMTNSKLLFKLSRRCPWYDGWTATMFALSGVWMSLCEVENLAGKGLKTDSLLHWRSPEFLILSTICNLWMYHQTRLYCYPGLAGRQTEMVERKVWEH